MANGHLSEILGYTEIYEDTVCEGKGITLAKKKVLVSLPEDLLSRLDAFCEKTGVSRSGYISLALSSSLPQSAPSADSEIRGSGREAEVRGTAEPAQALPEAEGWLGLDLSAWDER